MRGTKRKINMFHLHSHVGRNILNFKRQKSDIRIPEVSTKLTCEDGTVLERVPIFELDLSLTKCNNLQS